MPPPRNNPTDQLYNQVVETFVDIKTELAELSIEIKNLKDGIGPITAILHGDATRVGIVTQIALLRQELSTISRIQSEIQTEIGHNETNTERKISQIRDSNQKDKLSKRTMAASLIVAVIAAIGAIIAAIISSK